MSDLAPSDSAVAARVEGCQALVRSLAWKVYMRVGRRVDLDDLISYGQVGLLEAARRFDPDRSVSFSTFAYRRIRGAIFDGLSKMSWFRPAAYHGHEYELRTDEILCDELGPGSDDPQAESGWLADLGSRLAMVCFLSGSAGLLSEDGAEAPLDEALDLAEQIRTVRLLVDELPERARLLIRAVYFENQTLEEAGALVGVGKSWASRLRDQSLRQLAVRFRQCVREMGP